MIEASVIVDAASNILDAAAKRDLDGVALLVTAGPTHEELDPVRYLGNRSSGKMGFALARRAAARGARVTLIAGPVSLPTPPGVTRVDVTSAREMHEAVTARDTEARAVIMAAAVADYRPSVRAAEKMKKGEEQSLAITLELSPDILADLAARRRARGGSTPLLVGFAAETGGLDEKAQAKLGRKGCDLLVGNDVSEPGSAFGGDTNRITLYAPGAPPDPLPLLTKDEAADRVLDRVAALLGR
jgi:phosphopantothenoylcysteine decarboxylase/phosphopantothenate--cysteine ligase